MGKKAVKASAEPINAAVSEPVKAKEAAVSPLVSLLGASISKNNGAKEHLGEKMAEAMSKYKEAEKTDKALAGRGVIGLLFTQHDHAACTDFVGKLAKAYRETLYAKGLEVVFISCDESLSQYQQAATKDLKSAIGLAPGQGSLSYSSAAPGSSFASAAPGSAFSPIKPAAVTNGSNSASKALPRARLPPPSKIPSSAVEMPGDSLSNLDVQFGGLDLQFGGSNNENNSTNFDFGAGSPPSQKQDLEKERFSSIPPGAPGKPEAVGPSASLDSYKSQGASQSAGVKDVGQSLSSALASAGIKPSSSTDSVPGYGRVGEAGGSSRSSETGKSQGYGAQRSPGPLLAKAENLGGYNNGPSYSGYQGGKAGQGFPQSSGYPGGFDRQQSYNSGASSNGLTGGYSRYL
jgi:hypothetical protein